MRRAVSTRRLSGTLRGLTLLEVLIALALSSVLLTAVYVAMDLHWKYSSAGRDEAERSQLARAIANRLEVDLRSVVYRPQEPTGGEATDDTGDTSGSTSGSGTDPTTGDSSASTEPPPDGEVEVDPTNAEGTGLFGNATTLLMHISQPSKTLAYIPLGISQPGERTSDLLSVSWFVASRDASGLQGAVAQDGEGLTRTSGDRLTSQLADEEGNLDALASTAMVLAPEVTAIRFQYFDGADWRADWDSDLLGGLPRAIEIVMDIRASGSHKRSDDMVRTYRMVVALPIAKPLPI